MILLRNNMYKYLLSICIPTYNRSHLLKGLIENIYSEIDKFGNEEDVQVLVVDGKSEDSTAEVIDKIMATRKLKYFRREKKVGIDRDILKCVELADGKYCWLFSDDDRFTPGAISHLLDILKNGENLTGCFCNRLSYDFQMEKKVAEVNGWPGKIMNNNRIFTDKPTCFQFIGMDFGFISSQIVKRSEWQKVVEKEDFEDLYDSYYLMVHIIGKMMDKEFKWLYINRPMLMQRTGNDSLLKSSGVINRQIIEHNSFERIINRHYDRNSEEYRIFFKKMVIRLPRVVANFKSQHIDYRTQRRLMEIYYGKYKSYCAFWFRVIPIFIIPNAVFYYIKKMYYKFISPVQT
jgi:abequosyltransferase